MNAEGQKREGVVKARAQTKQNATLWEMRFFGFVARWKSLLPRCWGCGARIETQERKCVWMNEWAHAREGRRMFFALEKMIYSTASSSFAGVSAAVASGALVEKTLE